MQKQESSVEPCITSASQSHEVLEQIGELSFCFVDFFSPSFFCNSHFKWFSHIWNSDYVKGGI